MFHPIYSLSEPILEKKRLVGYLYYGRSYAKVVGRESDFSMLFQVQSSLRSDEGLTLETSAFESLYGG